MNDETFQKEPQHVPVSRKKLRKRLIKPPQDTLPEPTRTAVPSAASSRQTLQLPEGAKPRNNTVIAAHQRFRPRSR